MKFGFMSYCELSRGADSFPLLVEEAQAVEAAGFAYYSVIEHHQSETREFSSPLLWLGALASHTRRLRLGVTVLLLPLYHPARLAEEIAAADVIAGGRTFVAVALGYQPRDFAMFGVPMSERVSRFREGVQILKQSWEQDKVTYHGKHFQLDGVAIRPRPLQTRIPLWGGGNVERSARRAAQECDAWVSGTRSTPAELKSLAKAYRETATALGKQPEVILCRDCWLADSREAAWAEYGAAMARHRNSVLRQEGKPESAQLDELPLAEPGASNFILGSAADCIRQIEWYREACGAETIMVRMRLASGPDRQQVLRTVERFGREVVAHFTR